MFLAVSPSGPSENEFNQALLNILVIASAASFGVILVAFLFYRRQRNARIAACRKKGKKPKYCKPKKKKKKSTRR